MKVAVITISDRASRGEYADLSGPEIEKDLRARFPDAEVSRAVVPDEPPAILSALESSTGADFILTTGGTGISPRDITPEVTMEFCDRELPRNRRGAARGITGGNKRRGDAFPRICRHARHDGGGELPRLAESSAAVHEGDRTGHGARGAHDPRRGALGGARAAHFFVRIVITIFRRSWTHGRHDSRLV